MQASESYEWLLNACLQECRKGISHLEGIAGGGEVRQAWLREDLGELLALEAAAIQALTTLQREPDPSEDDRNLAQEKLDRLQSRLLESFHRLANEGLPVSSCL